MDGGPRAATDGDVVVLARGLEQRRVDHPHEGPRVLVDEADPTADPRRAAPSRARASLGFPAAKKMQSPGSAPVAAARPARSSSEMFFATGPPSVPSSARVTYARPRAPRCFAHSCHASKVRRGCDPPPGITTAPTYGAWNTRNGVEAKYAVRSVSSSPKRRSGLSVPYRSMASR